MCVMMKRTIVTISALLLLLTAMLLAVACKDKNLPEEDETLPADIGAIVAGDAGSVFTIVYPTRWTDAEFNGAQDIEAALKAKYRSVPAMKNDSTEGAADAYEILVGNTNREESAQAVAQLNEYGWTISVIGNRIVINAKNNLMIPDAVAYFINSIGDAEKLGINTVKTHVENLEKYNAPYVIAVDGRSVYTLSYSANASDYLKSAAMNFSSDMRRNGVAVTAKSGSVSSGKKVTVSTLSSLKGWEIVFEENGNIALRGEDDAMTVNALNYFAANFMKKDGDGDILVSNAQKVSDTAEQYAREGWLLAAPAYEGGILSQRLYHSGVGISKDNGSISAESTYMMSVRGTSHIEFGEYLTKLTTCGYVIDSESSMRSSGGGTNRYVGLKKDYQYLYVYYLAETNEVRVIDDRASVLESEFEYTVFYDSSTGAEIYMYGLKQDAVGGGSGSLMIVKQADNSVILIDGGSGTQATPTAVDGLLDFLQMITDKSSKEKVVVSCWFITHPHEDHGAFLSKMINSHRDKLDIQRVMFNFPAVNEISGFELYAETRDTISSYFPNAKVLKCHTGQSIQLGSVIVDVLATHEDTVDSYTGKTMMTEGNSTVSVVRITLPDGTRFMSLGDYTAELETMFLKMYATAELECRITDVAHHGYNSLPNIYNAIGAKYALWSNYSNNQFSGWHLAITEQVKGQLRTAGVEEIYYAGLNTVKLECKNGEVQVTKLPTLY